MLGEGKKLKRQLQNKMRLVGLLLTLVLVSVSTAWANQLAAPSTTVQAVEQITVGTTQVGALGISETTAQIMERERTRPPVTTPRRWKPERENESRRTILQNPGSPSVAQWPPLGHSRPETATQPLVAQTFGTSFTGATLSETGAFPPDTMGAVGPTQFFVFLNGRLKTFNKTTGTPDAVINVDADVFFAPAMTPIGGGVVGNFTSDPRVRYDRPTGRWFLVIIDVPDHGTGPGDGNNRILLAVSDATSGTISGSTVWTFFQFTGDATLFADYPSLGIDNNALYIGANMFGALFDSTKGYVVRKSSILGAGPIVVTSFPNLAAGSGEGPFTPQGVDNTDPAATEGYFIGVSNAAFGRLVVRRVSDPGGTPTISGNILLTVPSTYFPQKVPHMGNTGGTNGRLDGLDDRLFAAGMRNGRLWTAHNILVTNAGVGSNTGTRNGSRWYEIQNLNSTPLLVQSGTMFDAAATNPLNYWIPSINVSGQGHAVLGFSVAGAAAPINAGAVGRLATDTAGTMQLLSATNITYTNTSTAYNPPSDPGGSGGRRWGDYSYTSVDPTDDMTMWTIQEFCNATNSYGVQVVKLIAPPPATPSQASQTLISTGQASVSVTITGTQASGSGFFDPGAGFPNHILASVTGGVTVNGITYVNPTKVILDISTVGATVGAKDVTITNPDGQSRTGIGLFTVQAAPATTSTPTSTGTVVSGATPTACPIQFEDVPADYTFYSVVRCLACRNILSGYACGGAGEPCGAGNKPYFRPSVQISRGQIAKIVSQSAGLDSAPGTRLFEDVPEASPFFAYIQRLTNNGYMGGYTCGQLTEEPCVAPDNRPYFRPSSNASRGQLSKIVSNAALINTVVSGQTYEDVPGDSPFYMFIERLSDLNVMSGYACGSPGEPCGAGNKPYFRPNANVTRGQASKIVANTFYPGCQTPARR